MPAFLYFFSIIFFLTECCGYWKSTARLQLSLLSFRANVHSELVYCNEAFPSNWESIPGISGHHTVEMLAHGIVYHHVYGTASNALVLCFVYLKLNLETFFFLASSSLSSSCWLNIFQRLLCSLLLLLFQVKESECKYFPGITKCDISINK